MVTAPSPSLTGRRGREGQALLEFLIAFPVLLILCLSTWQLALMYNCKHLLGLAAFQASREASLQIPQDLSHEGGPRAGEFTMSSSDPKYRAIFEAAAKGLVPCSPRYQQVFQGIRLPNELDTLLVGLPLPEDPIRLADRYGYALESTDINIRVRARGAQEWEELSHGYSYTLSGDEDIEVTVDHSFYLMVPLTGWQILGTLWEVGQARPLAKEGARFMDLSASVTLPMLGWSINKAP